MEKINIYFRTVSNYVAETITDNDVVYKVVPVVMMVEGVHSGNFGPTLHTAEKLGEYADAWEGVPVVINHPKDQSGNYISANSEDVLSESGVGIIKKPKMVNKGLNASLWLKESELETKSPVVLEKINSGEKIEVSIGAFSTMESESGEYNNEPYEKIAINYIPDHLALLPGGTGACSVDKGCGIRVNEKGGKSMEKFIHAIRAVSKEGFKAIPMLNANEVGFQELHEKVSNKLYAMDTEQKYYYVEDVFSTYVIYRVRDKQADETKLFKQMYQINNDGKVDLVGEAVEVQRKVEYVVLNENEEEINMEVKPCVKEKVNSLIANEATRFSETDRSWMEKLELENLEKFEPKQIQTNQKETTSAVSKEKAIEVLGINGLDSALSLVSADEKAKVEKAMAAYAKQREETVDSIMQKTGDVWTKEELIAMEDSALDKIAKSVDSKPKNVNRSVMGVNGDANELDEEDGAFAPLPIAGYELKSEK